MQSISHSHREPRALNIEPHTVIVYFQAQIAVRTSQANRHALRAAMLRSIMRCFLQYPEKGQRDIRAVPYGLGPVTSDRGKRIMQRLPSSPQYIVSIDRPVRLE
jgi:hypothetical protein